MPTVFEKLNLKDQNEILILNAPSSFGRELNKLKGVTIQRDAKKLTSVDFALAFVVKQAEVDSAAKTLAEKMKGDAILWFAYPKGTSKRYKCEFNRDNGWDVIRAAGFDTVRAVAIDEDWSALRFRRNEFIHGGTGSQRKK
ncbi:MAG TPA: hypothetical protein VMX38_22020 [Verrucomicrobiae bacterium]|jgi:hypothetical protein|nr:hypothetical protein [Verrucomicrobiae bacterium]